MSEKITPKIFGWPFWLFITLPISGFSFLSMEFLFVSIEEFILIFVIFWFFLFNKGFIRHKNAALLVFLLINVLIYTFPLLVNASFFDLAKEFKPYFFILVTLFFLAFSNKSFLIRPETLLYLLSLAIVIDLLGWFVLTNYQELIPEGIRKEFFIRNGIYRYSDSSILLVQTLTLIAFFQNKNQMSKLVYVFFLYCIVVYLTQDRVYLLFGLVAFFMYSSRKSKVLIIFMIAFLGVVVFDRAFNSIESSEVSERFYSLFDIVKILHELLSRFITPAVEGGYEFNMFNFIFGSGMDFKFYIPWYEYRGLNPYHNSVDSFFVTFFIKHGIIGLALFVFILHLAVKNQPSIVYFWFLVYLVVHNGFYVTNFLLMIVFLSFFYANPSIKK